MAKNPKTVVLGITGSIAAYKTPELIRLLKKAGLRVIPVLTESGQKFVTSVTLKSVSGEAVITDLFDKKFLQKPIRHMALAEEADLILIAPATANIIAKIASGIADDFLSTLVTSADCPVLIAPAMNEKMYLNQVTQENIKKLKKLGYHFIGPACGALACGTSGPGRMEENEKILAQVLKLLRKKEDLKGQKILVTAGPTREFIDPVRFISNASSGKMGLALAQAASQRGGEVTLVAGPIAQEIPAPIKKISITSAQEMAIALKKLFSGQQILIMASAPADFKPVKKLAQKIKKGKLKRLAVVFKPTEDILKSLARLKKPGQIVVGFCLETEKALASARQKIQDKNLDFMVVNQISPKTGFESETNEVTILDKSGRIILKTKTLPKEKIAELILDVISKVFPQKK